MLIQISKVNLRSNLLILLISLTAVPSFSELVNLPTNLPLEFQITSEEEFKAELSSRLIPLSVWIQQMNSEPIDFICLGETHDQKFREFYASKVFSALRIDTLALEETAAVLKERLTKEADASTFSFLGADMKPVLEAAKKLNPNLRIVGVEATDLEKKQIATDKSGNKLSRDGYIAHHIVELLEPNKRTLALYGSLHCGTRSIGLGFTAPFYKLLQQNTTHRPGMKNLTTLFQENYSSILRLYVDSFELAKEDMVLVNPLSIDMRLYNYRADLFNELNNYEFIILPKANYLPADPNEK